MFLQQKVIGNTVPLINEHEVSEKRVISETFLTEYSLSQPSAPMVSNKTLTFASEQRKTDVMGQTAAIVSPIIGFLSMQTGMSVAGFHSQMQRFIGTLQSEQARLNEQTQAYLAQKYASGEPLTATLLRNKSNWYEVKSLRVRAELMKLQAGAKAKLPITDIQRSELKVQLKDVHLDDLNDPKVREIIDKILKSDDKLYMNALKDFQSTGKISKLIQSGKTEELSAYLRDHDSSKITGKEFKYIKDNFMEKTEIHHRTSISADPYQQSDINNLDILNTTEHNAKHTNLESGKIDYRRQTMEEPIDQINQLNKAEHNGVIIKKLTGLGIAAAIGMGTGFAIGFIVSLAQNGMNPESLKYSFMSGIKQGTAISAMAVTSTVIGRTIGQLASKAVSNLIINSMKNQAAVIGKTLAKSTVENIVNIVNLSVVGALTTLVFSIYEFAKLKRDGYNTRECILRTSKSAAISLTMLALSVVAQGIWGGIAGIAVSIVVGIVMVGFSVSKIQRDKEIMQDIMYSSIEQSAPVF